LRDEVNPGFGLRWFSDDVGATAQHVDIPEEPTCPIIATVMCFSWCALFVLITAVISVLTVIGSHSGCCLRSLAADVLFPFGKHLSFPMQMVIWIVFLLFFVVPLSMGAAVSGIDLLSADLRCPREEDVSVLNC
jgi:hypothetical protein